MSSSKKTSQKSCNRHQFSLKPKNNSCFYQQPINLHLCLQPKIRSKLDKQKLKQKQRQKDSQAGYCYQGPIFNRDRNYLTSSFIINSDKKKYNQNSSLNDNQNKYQNFHDEKSQMLVPKPNSKNMYCNVCKEKYEDYLEHIKLLKHKKRIQHNAFQSFILEMQEKYKNNRVNFKLKERDLTITQASNLIVIDQSSNEIEELSRPIKKVKREKNENQTQKPKQQNKTAEDRNKQFQQYNNFYDQLFHRIRSPYWDLLQLNSIPLQYNSYLSQMIIPSTQPLQTLQTLPDLALNPYLNLNFYSSNINTQQNYPFLFPFLNVRTNPPLYSLDQQPIRINNPIIVQNKE